MMRANGASWAQSALVFGLLGALGLLALAIMVVLLTRFAVDIVAAVQNWREYLAAFVVCGGILFLIGAAIWDAATGLVIGLVAGLAGAVGARSRN